LYKTIYSIFFFFWKVGTRHCNSKGATHSYVCYFSCSSSCCCVKMSFESFFVDTLKLDCYDSNKIYQSISKINFLQSYFLLSLTKSHRNIKIAMLSRYIRLHNPTRFFPLRKLNHFSKILSCWIRFTKEVWEKVVEGAKMLVKYVKNIRLYYVQ
jgi:hypothetical protein